MNIDPMAPRTPYEVSPKRYSVSHQMATTAFELPNFHVTQTLGVVRGIVVRSRNVFATLGATFQQVVGGNITIWTKMCEETRRDAFDIMIQHASEIGARSLVASTGLFFTSEGCRPMIHPKAMVYPSGSEVMTAFNPRKPVMS